MTERYLLAHGTHVDPDEGRCAMEWVAHLAGEPHSDEPACVSPVLRALCITLNDGLADGPRQRLRPYLAQTIGTAGDGLDRARSWLAMDWLVRCYAPAWLELSGMGEPAAALSAAAPVLDRGSLHAVVPLLGQARQLSRAARLRAFGGPTRWAAAVAHGRSGRETAWACAGAAAWAAARTALADGDGDVRSGPRDGDRARARLRAVAGDSAAIAVVRACEDEVCGPLTRADAVQTAIGPTLDRLTDSALMLLARMLPTVELDVSSVVGAGPRAIAG